MVGAAAALGEDAGVVVLGVVAVEARQQGARFLVGGAEPGVELIGQREEQHEQRALVVGLDGEDVEADALGLDGLVEQAIALGLVERGGQTFAGQLLQLVGGAHHLPPNTRNSRLTGS